MLTMGGRTILNIRDFREHFSPADALRQHRAFAAFAMRTLSRTDDCSRAMSMLFALASMQMDGRIDRLNPAMLPHLRVPYQAMRALLDAPVPKPDRVTAYFLPRIISPRTEESFRYSGTQGRKQMPFSSMRIPKMPCSTAPM